ncbi:hypothetical protein PF005_g9020 [Phytophthora fragariae]|uniref:Uncharacterized protein n=2 Tax=Phytophthora TaxID=4783 RepID=A0A6A3MF22_9STRA|nr:hypothetical protein PF003_g4283 [Phytophthora fragariae]KAE9038693.1 hypothetical protein PR002_g5895 [Phytophthora rubi]KAE8940219.1 hypothetical protein PF009_g9956 [Phytophthora fragariae]KAE9028115.1 hypothetical protein PF011_g1736 [Phytophthora fragariae]KAE9044329.1 hypothetical protein PR001_g5424 [Phytophthora rubi]
MLLPSCCKAPCARWPVSAACLQAGGVRAFPPSPDGPRAVFGGHASALVSRARP